MSLTMLDLNNGAAEQGPTYGTGPVSPLPRIWIGFLLAFAFLVGEVVEAMQGNSTDIGLFTLVAGLGGWLYWLSCVQRFHTILNQISPHVAGEPTYPIKPRQAVRYHFFPFYNLYWVFKWPLELSRYLASHTSVKIVSGAFLGMLILLSVLVSRLFDGFIGLSLLFGVAAYISRRLREAVVEHEQTRGAAGTFA
jgi:hypothetical protein